MYVPKAYDTKGKGIKYKMRKKIRKLGKWDKNKTSNAREPNLDHLGSPAHHNSDSCSCFSQRSHGQVILQALIVLEGYSLGQLRFFNLLVYALWLRREEGGTFIAAVLLSRNCRA